MNTFYSRVLIVECRKRWNKSHLTLVAVLGALVGAEKASGQATNSEVPASSGSSTNATTLGEVMVIGHLDEARAEISPDLGASSYTMTKSQIETLAQGANAPFNQLILRAPGVAQDSLGQLHLRDEHANLQYRINDVLLPEGITGFGQELDTRFVDSMRVITGSLPAQYGFRTAGIVDITTKSGAFDPGGDVSLYGGTYDTLRPSGEFGGSSGKLNYFVDGSYDHNNLGIENPAPSARALHDTTDQYKTFSYWSYLIDDTSRISFMLSASYADFQIPDTAGLPAGKSPNGTQWIPGNLDSATLNENQAEQNYYGVVAWQKSLGDVDLQIAGFGRNSSVHFTPDPIGDLYFNGVASDVNRSLYTGGLQADASYKAGDSHTIRGGLMAWDEGASVKSTTTVFAVDAAGNPIAGQPALPVADNQVTHGAFYGFYLQDEWKISNQFTLNYGARFDAISSFIHENQVSPRANLIWAPLEQTTVHLGYSRYFTPPPLELVRGTSLSKFANTSNAALVAEDDPVQSERSHYFDLGVEEKITSSLRVGIDGYYKIAHNQLDDGFFGQTLILSPFNYRVGQTEGVEFTVSYNQAGFEAYANVAIADGYGKDIRSAQFLFDPATIAYSQANYIHMDHDQRVTGSFGSSYEWKRSRGSTKIYMDALYGSGLRTDLTDASGNVIPNGGVVGAYYSINIGAEEVFQIKERQALKARLDVVNITDKIYELRNGSGVGVNAAQYGMRLGLFGQLCYVF